MKLYKVRIPGNLCHREQWVYGVFTIADTGAKRVECGCQAWRYGDESEAVRHAKLIGGIVFVSQENG